MGKACPSCGRIVDLMAQRCACGARWVAQHPLRPEVSVPQMGWPLAAGILLLVILVVETIILAHEVYVSPLVWTAASIGMILYLSRFVIPAAGLVASLAYVGWKRAQRDPARYGGARVARVGLVVALLLLVGHTAVVVSHIPRMLENRRIRKEAATRANLYRLARALEAYRQQYGIYPRRLIDLQEMDPTLKPVGDAWGREFVYQAISGDVAAAAVPMPFQRYQLISKGPDGILGTDDDLILRDDVCCGAGTGSSREGPRP